jgi:hypothetical protein
MELLFRTPYLTQSVQRTETYPDEDSQIHSLKALLVKDINIFWVFKSPGGFRKTKFQSHTCVPKSPCNMSQNYSTTANFFKSFLNLIMVYLPWVEKIKKKFKNLRDLLWFIFCSLCGLGILVLFVYIKYIKYKVYIIYFSLYTFLRAIRMIHN